MNKPDAGRATVASRIIITGANGSGKSHLACRLTQIRPDLPNLSFDAMKLTTDWQTRPRAQIDKHLQQQIAERNWVLEGGPSLLPLALPRAEAVIWLDPPTSQRAWRLFKRPWTTRGTTRPELPEGNVDFIIPQTGFAWRSLRKSKATRSVIQNMLSGANGPMLFHCKTQRDIEHALAQVCKGSLQSTKIGVV